MKDRELMPHQVAEWRACSSDVLLSCYGRDRRSRLAADGGLWPAADGTVLFRGPAGRYARTRR